MKPAALITLVLAEDHVVVREGLCALLRASGLFDIVGEARNGREAVKLCLQLRPQVILMDIAMPVLNGIEATRQILTAHPEAKIIILSAHSDSAYLEHLTAAGAVGFLEKQTSAQVLVHALLEVAKGHSYFSPAIARHLKESAKKLDRDGQEKPQANRLTSREVEVLQQVAEGSANKQIAVALNISSKTVEKHRQNLMDKLNIHDTASLTRYAISTGIIENPVQLKIT